MACPNARRLRTKWIAAVGLALAALAPRGAAAQQALGARYRPGDATQTEMRSETVSIVTAGGMNFRSTSTYVINTVERVLTAEPDRATVEKGIRRLRFEINGPQGETFQYDTQKPTELRGPLAAAGALFRALAGLEFHSVLDARGQLVESDLERRMAAVMKRDEKLGDALPQLLPEDVLQQLAGASRLVLPAGPVRAGDQWSSVKSLKDPMLGTQKVELQFTYVGPVNEQGQTLERIRYETRTDFDPQTAAEVKVKVLSQQFNGEILFDAALGRIVSDRGRQSVELMVAAGDRQILQKHETQVTITVAPLEAADAPGAAPGQ